MRHLAHLPRRSTAVLVALAALALSLAVISRPIVPARADDSQNVTIAQAAAQAAETGQPVLATAETTETSSVVANPDGTLTATLGAGPLQEPDSQSSTGWAPIDLTLQHVDGTYAPAVSGADTTFSDGGSGALATLDQGSTTYTENWDGSLPTPTVSGTTATYANVLPNIDLVMSAQTTGFKQSFVVKVAPTQQLTLDVPLSLRGLTATVDDNGNLIVTDSHGDTVATAGTAVMYGAAMNPSGEPTISATVDTQVVNGQHGPVFEITPDSSFFSNPDLTYPVTIDPSPNLNTSNDTYVKSTDANSSFSTETVLKVGTPNDGTDVYRTLLEFAAVSTLNGGDPIFVDAASLNLYETDSGSCTASELDLYDATSNWITVSPVTWNTQPSMGTLYASASFAHGHNSSCPNAAISLEGVGADGTDLVQLVQAWADGTSPNYGMVIVAASESSTDGYKKFKSSDYGSNAPTLSVTYETDFSSDWQTLTIGTIQEDGSQEVSFVDQYAEGQPTVVCHIDTASWKISAPWQVALAYGGVHCSIPVSHYEQFKTVKKHCFIICWWTTEKETHVTKPSSGYAYSVSEWDPRLTILSAGTYHIHVNDLVTTQSGYQVYLVNTDGPDFQCNDGTGCH